MYTFMHICANTHSKNIILFSDVHENSHMDVHYMADEDYYVRNGISPTEATDTCHLFGFQLDFSTFSLLPLLMGNMMTLSQINQLIRCTPSEN